MLTAYINKDQDNWDEYLDQLIFAYYLASKVTPGFSPFEVHFGEKPKVPLDLFYNTLSDEDQTLNEKSQAEIVSD